MNFHGHKRSRRHVCDTIYHVTAVSGHFLYSHLLDPLMREGLSIDCACEPPAIHLTLSCLCSPASCVLPLIGHFTSMARPSLPQH